MPNNIITAQVEIIGKRSLFFHPFGEDSIPREKQEQTGVAGNDPWTWMKTTPCTSTGQLYLMPTYVFASIREGGYHIKFKGGNVKKLVIATMQVTDEIILVDRFLPPEALKFIQSKGREGDPLESLTRDRTQPVYLDVRGGKNPSTNKGMVIYRVAASPGWHLSFNLEWDKTVMSRDQLHSAILNAGQLEGIGNGRKIGMGRFDLVSFTVFDAA
jgi:hypothetical protein